MIVAFEQTPEYQLGRKREEQFLRYLASCGAHVIPVYGAIDVDDSSKSPKVWTPGGKVVAADILAISPEGLAIWVEVKAKKKPGFMWASYRRGFTHGVDYRLFNEHYRILAGHVKGRLSIVICETMTLPHPDWEPATEKPVSKTPSGAPNWGEYESSLIPGPVWLRIEFEDALRHGYRHNNWSHGKTGWIWPRSAMQVIDVPLM